MRHGLAIADILDFQGRRFSELPSHSQPVVRYAPSHPARGAQTAFDSAPRRARNGSQRSGSPIVQLNLCTMSRMERQNVVKLSRVFVASLRRFRAVKFRRCRERTLSRQWTGTIGC